jgi:hypothetical protein
VNINKLKPYQYLDKSPRGLEATVKGGGEHKEDSQSTKKIFLASTNQNTKLPNWK